VPAWLDPFALFAIAVMKNLEVPDMQVTKAFYSPREVAEIAGLHPSTILNSIASGRVYAVKLSERTYRIPARSVMHLLAPTEVEGPVVIRGGHEDDVAADASVESEVPVPA
jgi:excisionase family DNA binding protein